MTHRSRNGGPPKTHRKKNQNGPKRKLHHPPSQPTSQPDLSDSPSDNSEFPPLPIKQFDSPTESDLLVVVHRALRQTLDNPTFSTSVQTVKALLYNRKWLEVFTNPVLLEVYVGRWVPSRGVCYRELMIRLGAIRGLFRPSLPSRHDEEEEIDDRLMKSRSQKEGMDNEGQKEENEVFRLQKGIKDGSGGNKEEIIDIISLGG
ncbi:hypothetical protein TREMEDRAFT_70672, partial [Tremella mesenterica DSM 1558]|uniref:uncharacterized protein n=1 Tax=Tremella mesenterica (strain ATCC 24925 / CBS 8224 / DSM 1558 / NBRC 9311 / NRRL Y-6157 / RJB 2259-6 / UBC 559-6) TaxID=578456 RepID=UPI0003F49C2B